VLYATTQASRDLKNQPHFKLYYDPKEGGKSNAVVKSFPFFDFWMMKRKKKSKKIDRQEKRKSKCETLPRKCSTIKEINMADCVFYFCFFKCKNPANCNVFRRMKDGQAPASFGDKVGAKNVRSRIVSSSHSKSRNKTVVEKKMNQTFDNWCIGIDRMPTPYLLLNNK
jgi:hypothetical protein